MRVFWVLVGLVLLCLFAPRLVVGAEPAIPWRTDFEAALREAEERNLPLILHFYADWCMPCQKMESTVFGTDAVRKLLRTHFVSAKLNSEKNQHLVRAYGFEILPTDLVIDPRNGRLLARHSGYLDQAGYLNFSRQADDLYQKSPKPTPLPELGDPEPVVGLDGFSPVALMKKREWVRGSAKFVWDYRGIPYHMATREELVEFRKTPDAFAPKFLGCDPVILWETDRTVAGSSDYAAFYDDDLYLFKTEQRRQQFKANPKKFTQLQQAIKPSQIERTAIR